MTNTYIVTESTRIFSMLENLLPTFLITDVELIDEATSYDAHSLASSILLTKQRPVVLVMNADTNDEEQIRERQTNLEFLLGRASFVPHLVLLAVPEIDAVFFEDRATLERLFDYRFTDIEWTLALRSPKVWLENQLAGRDIFDLADEPAIETWRNHKLMLDLMAFLHAQTAPVQ